MTNQNDELTSATMDFWNYTTLRDTCKQSKVIDVPADDPDEFYRFAFADAVQMRSGQFCGQLQNEQDWEQAHRPYYNVWPSIVPMLTRLDLNLDSGLIQLSLPTLSVRFPKQQNPLTFDWKGDEIAVRSLLMGEINDGTGISILIDIGEIMNDVPLHTYRNFPRRQGLTVEQSLAGLPKGSLSEVGIQIPDSLATDCVRLCCTLCLLENDPAIISPDVLSKDRVKFERTGDETYVVKAHRRGKVGWDVGRQIEVAPHYRRPHLMLAWTGTGRSVPKIVPRRGSVVHRSKVEKVPSGFGE